MDVTSAASFEAQQKSRSSPETCWSDNTVTRTLFRHRVMRNIAKILGPRYVEYSVAPIRMYLDLKEQWGVSKMILKHGYYDPLGSRLMKEWIGPHGNMIDVGANIGYYSLLGAHYSDGRVFAFEPEEHNFEMLSKNVALNGFTNITTARKAAGDVTGKLTLYKSTNNAGDHTSYRTPDSREPVEVDIVRIDDVLSDIRSVEFIKIDVQGYEEKVVRGMERILRTCREVKVCTEFWPHGLRQAGSSADGFLDFMESLDFTWHVLNEESKTMEVMDRKELLQLCPGDRAVDLLFSRVESRHLEERTKP